MLYSGKVIIRVDLWWICLQFSRLARIHIQCKFYIKILNMFNSSINAHKFNLVQVDKETMMIINQYIQYRLEFLKCLQSHMLLNNLESIKTLSFYYSILEILKTILFGESKNQLTILHQILEETRPFQNFLDSKINQTNLS